MPGMRCSARLFQGQLLPVPRRAPIIFYVSGTIPPHRRGIFSTYVDIVFHGTAPGKQLEVSTYDSKGTAWWQQYCS